MDDKIQREPDPVLLVYGVSESGDGFLVIEHLHRADVDEAVDRLRIGPGEYAVIRGEVLADPSPGVLHKTQIQNEQTYRALDRWLHEAEARKAAGHNLVSSDPASIGFYDDEDGTQHSIALWRVKEGMQNRPDLDWLKSPGGRKAWFGGKVVKP